MLRFDDRYASGRLRLFGPIAAIGLAAVAWGLATFGIVSIAMVGNVTVRCAFSTQDFDTCAADVMGMKTLVREGSHTHWVVKTMPHALSTMIFTTIGVWLGTLFCGLLAWRFLDTEWSDPNASLFPEITRYPIVNKVTSIALGVWCCVWFIMKLTTPSAEPPAIQHSDHRPVEESAQPHFDKGLALWNEGKADAAVTELREAARIEPSAPTYHWLAWIALQRHDLDGAIQWATRLAEIDRDYNKGSGYAIRAAAFYQQKNEAYAYPNAKEACKRGDAYSCTLAGYLWEQRDRWATPQMINAWGDPNH